VYTVAPKPAAIVGGLGGERQHQALDIIISTLSLLDASQWQLGEALTTAASAISTRQGHRAGG
jgi:hypothetical protein